MITKEQFYKDAKEIERKINKIKDFYLYYDKHFNVEDKEELKELDPAAVQILYDSAHEGYIKARKHLKEQAGIKTDEDYSFLYSIASVVSMLDGIMKFEEKISTLTNTSFVEASQLFKIDLSNLLLELSTEIENVIEERRVDLQHKLRNLMRKAR